MDEITFEGGPGDTVERAIVIRGAGDGRLGVEAEYQYLARELGRRGVDWQLERQSLLMEDDRHYDEMRILLSDGTRKVIYFDISDFFGKF